MNNNSPVNMKTLLTSLLLIITAVSSNAQKAWSLDDCIRYAFEHNIDIKQQQNSISSSTLDLKQSKYDMLPDLNARFSYSLNTGRYFDEVSGQILAENTNGLGAGLGSSIDVFNGLRKYYQQKYYDANLKTNLSDLDKAKNDISITIATAYLDILFNKELSALAQEQLALIQQQVEKTEKLVQAGNVAKGELLEIKAQEAGEKLELTRADNNLEIAVLNLVQLLDLDSIAGFDIQKPEFDHNTDYQLISFNELYNEALEAMPQIQSAELAIDAQRYRVEISKSYYMPSVSANYNFSTYYNDNLSLPGMDNYGVADQWKDNRGSSFGVSLNIPVFNRFQVNTGVAKAKLGVKSASYNLEQTKLNLYKEIQQAKLDLKSYNDSYFSAEEAVEYNKEAFAYTEQKLEVGLIDAVTYNTAKNNLRQAEVSLLQAKYQFVFQQKLLDFYTGKPISFKN